MLNRVNKSSDALHWHTFLITSSVSIDHLNYIIMKRYFFLAIAIMVGLVFNSCKKNSNTPPSQLGMSYELLATNTYYGVAKTTAASNIQWTSGFAYPDVVKFEATQNNLQVEFKSTNNARIDLLAPIVERFGNFTLPPGVYNKITLKIDLDRNDSTPVLQMNGTKYRSPTKKPYF